MSHNVTTDTLNNIPILTIAALGLVFATLWRRCK